MRKLVRAGRDDIRFSLFKGSLICYIERRFFRTPVAASR